MTPHTSPLFEGCATALVTPFQNGSLDKTAFLRLLRRQIERGIDALVVAGTTGESPTLTDAEKRWLFTAAVRRFVSGRSFMMNLSLIALSFRRRIPRRFRIY